MAEILKLRKDVKELYDSLTPTQQVSFLYFVNKYKHHYLWEIELQLEDMRVIVK